MSTGEGGHSSESGGAGGGEKLLQLDLAYPANEYMELTLSPGGEVVCGVVYCTDEVSRSIVLRKSLVHTTLASEVRVINASCVKSRKRIGGETPGGGGGGAAAEEGGTETKAVEEKRGVSSTAPTAAEIESLSVPLPSVSRRALEERERRALKLAEESLSHINRKASPAGQAVFDRLLKACNEVSWKGTSIIVLHQIRVDPPYGAGDCRMIRASESEAAARLHEGSLERVKKIVAAEPSS
uniref:AD domain-containing protein n=1 Tax=Odontella aurita TaxID=265563 RepID=A0A6U6HBK7_9STRA|mmetsp:Transcript_4697/g.13232  ORF Transcript_4697/g.13232 Transcript_4697/m.13232 type:complete len:240 (+) Transcript_4697:373-1092(+)